MSVNLYEAGEMQAFTDALQSIAADAGLVSYARDGYGGYSADYAPLGEFMVAVSRSNAQEFQERYGETCEAWNGEDVMEDARERAMYAHRARQILQSGDLLGFLGMLDYNGGKDHLSEENLERWRLVELAALARGFRLGAPFRYGHLELSREHTGAWRARWDDPDAGRCNETWIADNARQLANRAHELESVIIQRAIARWEAAMAAREAQASKEGSLS